MVLRPALPDDAVAVADVYLRSFDAALPTVRRAHSDDEVRAWVRDVLVPGGVVVADVGGSVVGLLVASRGWIEQLYVDPTWQRRGIATRLVSYAQQQEPDGLQLWTFQVDRAAQRFYERQGFVVVAATDGSTNEEREPDLRYAWAPPGRPPPSG